MTKKRKDPAEFEKALQELELLVEKMEKGDHSLEDSLRDFERGIQLTRSCQTALEEAELKVRVLIEKDGTGKLESFDSEPS